MEERIVPNSRQGVEFLKLYSPRGPWVLTAIIPDGETETITFTLDWEEGVGVKDDETYQTVEKWIEDRQWKKNIYFQVNPPIRPLTSKSSKTDILCLSYLHIDIDPRTTGKAEEERKGILEKLKIYNPKPTCILDSGNGYQGFWRVEPCDKLKFHGNLERAIELEHYVIQLEKIFDADSCHNIDRIMRLPGTINLPTKTKVKKGRKPCLSSVIEWNEKTYPIDLFTPAVQVQGTEGGLVRTTKIIKSGNIPDIGTEELRDWANKNDVQGVNDHCLALIATGEDPVDPNKYASRSEALFKVCCDLVRAGVPDEMIYAVITSPNNAISESVREKRGWENYAVRQIERAHEDAVDPILREFNEKHAVIADIGGKCRIVSIVKEDGVMMGRSRISKQSFEDFRNRYRHIQVQVGVGKNNQPMTKQAGAFWIDHPMRRQYEGIIFAPGREIPNYYNLWQGFSCDSLPGPNHESFLTHIRDNVCSGNWDHYRYLLGWLARLVQQPDSPGEVAVVLRGKRGTGKSFFAKQIGALFGRHYLQVSDSKHLVGSFNSHLRDTVLLFGDEAFFAGDRKHESVLKTLITEELIIVEGKGVDAEAAPNFVHLILASNENWVVPAGSDERRFFVLEVGNDKKQDHGYFKNIQTDLDNGGREHLLNYLLNHDLSQYEVRVVPQTRALKEQQLLSMSPETQWFFERVAEGCLVKCHQKWESAVRTDILYQDYLNEIQPLRNRQILAMSHFGRFLQKVLPAGYPTKKQVYLDLLEKDQFGYEHMVRKRVYIWTIPPLEAVRAHWDKELGGPFDWNEVQREPEYITKEEEPF